MELFLKEKRVWILLSLVALSFFLTLFHFTDTPKVWVDEGVFTETARSLAFHRTLSLQTDIGEFYPMKGFILSTSYPVIFPVATSLYLFGSGIWQARLPMVIYILLFIIISYLFIRKKYGEYPALLSTLLLLSFSPLYGNGRPVQGEVPGLFFFVLGLYFMVFLEEGGFLSKKWAVFSGLALGLSSATKPQYLTFVLVSVFVVFVLWFKKIKNKKIFIYFGIGFVVPIALWLCIHFPNLDSMKNIVSSYLYFAGNHGSTLSTGQTIVGNLFRFVKESTPILFSVLSLGVIVSFVVRLKGEKWGTVSVVEFLLLSFIFLDWLTYLKGTGWYRYFFPAHTLLYILFPASIIAISSFIKNKTFKNIILSLPILIIVFQFYFLVFLSDTSFVVTRTRNEELAEVLGKIDYSKKVLFYNSIETAIFLNGDNYSQYLEMEDFLVAGDKGAIEKPGVDFILTDKSQSGNVALSCYKESALSQYYFLEKTDKCK